MAQISTAPDLISQAAVRLRKALTAGTAMIVLLLVLERLGYAGAYGTNGLDLREAGVQLALSFPAIIYIVALWQLRQAAAEVGRGNLLGGVVVRAIKRVGGLLAGGAAVSLLGTPLFSRLAGEPVQRLINADVTTLVLAGIGIGLVFLASLIDHASAAAGELEEFF